jgi:hypothetical protein
MNAGKSAQKVCLMFRLLEMMSAGTLAFKMEAGSRENIRECIETSE